MGIKRAETKAEREFVVGAPSYVLSLAHALLISGCVRACRTHKVESAHINTVESIKRRRDLTRIVPRDCPKNLFLFIWAPSWAPTHQAWGIHHQMRCDASDTGGASHTRVVPAINEAAIE